MIDFHCHIDLFPDPVAVLDEVERRGTYVLAVTTTPKAWRGTRRLVGDRKRVRVALGLHPEVVAERHAEVALLCALMSEARYVGEVGLDGSPPHRASFDVQRHVFDRILEESARLGGRILSIHSRGAADQVLDTIERHEGLGIPILHWFSGTPCQLERAKALGCWFSVGPAMLRSEKGRGLCAAMPVDRLLTETDAPFARAGSLPLFPWEAEQCVPSIAALHGIAPGALSRGLKENLKTLVQWTPAPSTP